MDDWREYWSDDALLEFSRHDSEAFALLVERHNTRFRNYLRLRVGPNLVDDALAELWEIGFRRRHSFNAELGSATGWLYGIAKNVTRHVQQRSTRSRHLNEKLAVHEPSGGRAAGVDPADRVSDGESIDRIRDAVSDLPGHELEVVDLIIVQGLSYEAASERLAVPVGTVRSRLSRARRRLRHSSGNHV